MHFGAPALKKRFFARIPARLLGSPGVTGVDATIAAWDEGQPWLDEIMAQLQANRDWLAQTIGTELPGVTMRLPEATYLAWLDCSALELPCPAGQFFLDRARVGLNFGETFGAQYASFARLNFADAGAGIAARSSAAWPRRSGESECRPPDRIRLYPTATKSGNATASGTMTSSGGSAKKLTASTAPDQPRSSAASGMPNSSTAC